MLILRRIILISLVTLFVCANADSVSAQTLGINSGGGDMIGGVPHRQVDDALPLNGYFYPDDVLTGYSWTITGPYELLDGTSLSDKSITVKWTAAGQYQLTLEHSGPDGTQSVILYVQVSTEENQFQLTPLPCSEESSLSSPTAILPTSLQFYNYSDQPRRTHWLNYSGQRSSSADLPGDGGSMIWNGYEGMPFVVTDENDNCIEIYVMAQEVGRATTGARAESITFDQRFAPSVERFEFTYTVKQGAPQTIAFGKFEVFKNGDLVNPIYVDETIERNGSDLQYMQEEELSGWDGKMNQGANSGKYIEPKDSPFTMRLSFAEQANYVGGSKEEVSLQVEIESVAFTPSTAFKVYKLTTTETEIDEPIEALVKIKKKDGTGAVTAIPLKLDWSFEDPDDTATDDDIDINGTAGDDNALANKGGKRGDASMNIDPGIMWKTVPDYTANISADGQTADATTQTAGTEMGTAKLKFSASAIGGDNYILVGKYKKDDGTTVIEKKSEKWSVWKKLSFAKVYQMSGGADVGTSTSVANISPAFGTDIAANVHGYTEYTRVANVINLPTGAQSPEYIAPLLPPSSGESAQDWYQRNMNSVGPAIGAYITLIKAPPYSIIGARYVHPKLDGDNSLTNYFADDVRIMIGAESVDPDEDWSDEQGDEVLNRGFVFANIATPGEAVVVSRHEIGHASDHVQFGLNDDHDLDGLMHPNAELYTAPFFSPKSILRLRGVQP